VAVEKENEKGGVLVHRKIENGGKQRESRILFQLRQKEEWSMGRREADYTLLGREAEPGPLRSGGITREGIR